MPIIPPRDLFEGNEGRDWLGEFLQKKMAPLFSIGRVIWFIVCSGCGEQVQPNSIAPDHHQASLKFPGPGSHMPAHSRLGLNKIHPLSLVTSFKIVGLQQCKESQMWIWFNSFPFFIHTYPSSTLNLTLPRKQFQRGKKQRKETTFLRLYS